MPYWLVVFSKELPMNQFVMLKSHIDAYTRKDGVVVKAHEKRIEAHGVKGMKSTPWRKTFKSQKHFEEWQDKDGGNSEVHGFRELEHDEPDTNGKFGKSPKKIDLKSHPMWSQSDHDYFKGKGYEDHEIKALWDRDHAAGVSPVQHQKAPDVVGVVGNKDFYKGKK